MKIVRFPSNTAGRDMVVGDIHGHIDDLQTLLGRVAFNQERDRLFCTGDLVDRGPESMKCLSLTKKPWFHSIAGNHEQILAENVRELLNMGAESARESVRKIEKHLDSNGMGGGWLIRSFLRMPDRRHWEGVIKAVSGLPNLIIVGEGESRFHVVHGGLFIGQAVLDNSIIDQLEIHIRDGVFSEAMIEAITNSVTWHRSIAQLVQENWNYDATHEGLSITYCGHNVVPKASMALSHYHLDTGSGLQNRLGRRDYGLTMAVVENGFPVETLTTKERT